MRRTTSIFARRWPRPWSTRTPPLGPSSLPTLTATAPPRMLPSWLGSCPPPRRTRRRRSTATSTAPSSWEATPWAAPCPSSAWGASMPRPTAWPSLRRVSTRIRTRAPSWAKSRRPPSSSPAARTAARTSWRRRLSPPTTASHRPRKCLLCSAAPTTASGYSPLRKGSASAARLRRTSATASRARASTGSACGSSRPSPRPWPRSRPGRPSRWTWRPPRPPAS
mmetsp:Transcript_46960/g.134010  ORF Transcript_46960/g.134010 Transcript_46960/m.134010 type:complete len:223 (+) Transcript_46960:498-1166(+)